MLMVVDAKDVRENEPRAWYADRNIAEDFISGLTEDDVGPLLHRKAPKEILGRDLIAGDCAIVIRRSTIPEKYCNGYSTWSILYQEPITEITRELDFINRLDLLAEFRWRWGPSQTTVVPDHILREIVEARESYTGGHIQC